MQGLEQELGQELEQGLEQGAAAGEDVTQIHRDVCFHQPWSRIWAAQQETGKVSPSGSCSKGGLRPVCDDEPGRFAVPVAQGSPSRNSVGSSEPVDGTGLSCSLGRTLKRARETSEEERWREIERDE